MSTPLTNKDLYRLNQYCSFLEEHFFPDNFQSAMWYTKSGCLILSTGSPRDRLGCVPGNVVPCCSSGWSDCDTNLLGCSVLGKDSLFFHQRSNNCY